MKAKQSLLQSLTILSALFIIVNSLLEKEKGLNDWRIENLGEIKDLKFIEDSNLIYTLSENGVLGNQNLIFNIIALFDASQERIIWKKELPQKESFQLRYLSRNLLVYSGHRAMMVNSVGHVIYDIHFELGPEEESEKNQLVVEMFELNGHVYSCFAKDYKIKIYEDYQEVVTLEYVEAPDASDTTEKPSKNLRPLSLIFDKTSQRLMLLAVQDRIVGDYIRLKTFEIDLNRNAIQEINQKFLGQREEDISPFQRVERTLNYVALISSEKIQFLDLFEFKVVKQIKGYKQFQTSITDNYVLEENSSKQYTIINLKSGEEHQIPSKNETCAISKLKESEVASSSDNSESKLIFFTTQCQNEFTVTQYGFHQLQESIIYETKQTLTRNSNGFLKKGFIKQQQKKNPDIVVQFQDLSLHYIDNVKYIRWTREESLSQIKQVEIMDAHEIKIESELDYVKNVKEKTPLELVIPRIITRYRENIQYIINHLMAMIPRKDSDPTSIQSTTLFDQFGFNKVFVMLTNVGKIVALSSNNGEVLWQQYLGEGGNDISKILLRYIKEEEVGHSQKYNKQQNPDKEIVVIQKERLTILNPITGMVSYQIKSAHNDNAEFILVQLQHAREQLILQISQKQIENNERLWVYPDNILTPEILKKESIFFTQLDKENGILKGYKLSEDLKANLVWHLNIGKGEERILKIQTQFQSASEINHLHFVPTSFAGENIIFKYLDTNIFALATINTAEDLIIYLVNGVTGKVVYKFIERKVRLDQPIDMHISENIFVLSLQRATPSGPPQQEISVTELYNQRLEDNTKKLLVDYYKGDEKLSAHTFSSFSNEQPVVVQETYLLPFSVKQIALTQTLHHITGKHLIVLTTGNQLYSIDNALFSARRPHSENMVLSMEDQKKEGDKQLDLKSIDYPPYDAVIPLISTKFISYDLHLIDLATLKTFPTRLESTTQVLAYGFDVFFVRMSPENNFDLLQENFNYLYLFIFIFGLFVAMIVVRFYLQSTTLKNNFLML